MRRRDWCWEIALFMDGTNSAGLLSSYWPSSWVFVLVPGCSHPRATIRREYKGRSWIHGKMVGTFLSAYLRLLNGTAIGVGSCVLATNMQHVHMDVHRQLLHTHYSLYDSGMLMLVQQLISTWIPCHCLHVIPPSTPHHH